MVGSTLTLPDLLTQVATFAVQAIPHADGAGVTLFRKDRPGEHAQTLAASAAFVAEIDALQYQTLQEGPCITAADERHTMRSGELSEEPRWPRFGPRVGRLGVHSVLSLPLLIPDDVVGAINVYSHRKDAFDDHAAELGELFATPAAVAVHNAHALLQAKQLAMQLQTALGSRAIIDQAIGILRARSGLTEDSAFERLREISQTEHTKLAVVAQHVVDEAVRRAHARRAGD